MDDIANWVQGTMAVIGLAAAIATMTPNKSDNTILDFILRLINTVGANIGNAKNKP